MHRRGARPFGRYAGLAVDHPRQIGPRDPQVRGQGGNSQIQTFHILLNDLARMRGVIHPMRCARNDLSAHQEASLSSLMRPRSTCARSYWACCTSQLSALPPKTFSSRTAISGEMPRFPFANSESVLRVTPRAAAAAVM